MTVYLVGAGPGDPDLITVKGKELLHKADAVVYDRLANSTLLKYVKKDALLVAAGKGPGSVDLTQEQTNEKLVELGKKYQCVVRLKGGDPYVFGRGGEEAQFLIENGIKFEVVPGITSAISSLAYAGVPITHRGVATNFTVVTGHEDPTKPAEQVKWSDLAKIDGTIAVLMGVANRKAIAKSLIDGGKKPDTPVCIVRNGTLNKQEVTRTTLNQLGDVSAKSPSIIAIGPVAEMELDWFTNKPLFGKKVVVTRARDQQSKVSKKLIELGAQVIEASAIKIVPLQFEVPLLKENSYVVFTSTNGVEITFSQLEQQGLDARYFSNAKIAAIGQSTANELKKYGIIADLVPKTFVAEELLELFNPVDEKVSVYLFRAQEVREVLEVGLKNKGYEVFDIDVYKTVLSESDSETIEEVSKADAITFASSSTVDNAVSLFGLENVKGIPTKISIGPITSETMRSYDLNPTSQAVEHTIDGVVNALVEVFESK